jgi:DNA-binding NtrC family response regulator
MKHLLIIDDEPGSRQSLNAIFEATYRVSLAAHTEEAMRILIDGGVDLILLDVMMPQKDGVTFLKEVQNLYPGVPVVMVSASTSVRPVVEAIRHGAYDYVTKPFDVEQIRCTVERALESSSLHRRVAILETELYREFPVDGIVGASPGFRQALDDARKAAETDATVLIGGESGTGKELIARYIHAASKRRNDPFVAVHCAALPESLMESELFGHEKGAFTHAERRKPGRFDLAGSGTLFFDEVSEMSPATQVKLLRVLQEREFMRVGGTQVIKTNARIVAASAKDLKNEIRQGRFRDDLFYRLSVIPIYLPALRERPEDIPLLARYFMNYFSERIDVNTRDFDPETMEALCRYPWPGNIRELRNLVERVLVLYGRNPRILLEFLPEEFQVTPSPGRRGNGQPTLAEAVRGFESRLIEEALRKADGIQTRAAELLGTTRRILKYRMEKLNIGGANARR